MLLLLPIFLPLVGSVLVFREREERRRNRLVTATVLATCACALLVCLLSPSQLTLLTIDSGLTLALGSDFVSKFFLLLICVSWTAAMYFSFPYLRHSTRQPQFQGFFTLALGVLTGLALSQNFITLYLFFELMTLSTMPLVLHDGTEGARRAGVKYMGYSVFGAGLALGGYFFLVPYLGGDGFAWGGVLDSAAVPGQEGFLLLLWFCMVVGMGCKAGLLPMQSWLTTAHPVAPAPASALLSGVITKGGVLAILRMSYFLFDPALLRGSWAQTALLTLALFTVFVGSMLAYKEKILKKRLAYSTVSQVSYVLFGLFLFTEAGFAGALLQVLAHALAKNTLFLAAGAIIVTTSCTRVDQLRGIGRRMPVTMWCFAVAALSLVGIPPLGGFVSKWYLALGALEAGLGGFAVAGVAVLLLSALLTAGYLLPIITEGFFPGKDSLIETHEAVRGMTVPLLALAALSLLLGLWPGGVTALTQGLF